MAKKYELTEDSSDLESLARQVQGLAGTKKRAPAAVQVVQDKMPAWMRYSWVKALFFGGFVLLILLGAFLFILPGIRQVFAAKAPVKVPDVIGQNATAAQSILNKAGLKVKVEHVASNKPKDTVVAMKPLAGSSATEVTISVAMKDTVAGGDRHSDPNPKSVAPDPEQPAHHTPPVPEPTTKKAAVPDVEGMVEAKARALLEGQGLAVTVIQKQDPAQPDRVVLNCDPKPGTHCQAGDKIQLVVNNLPAQAQQPATNNQSLVTVADYTGRSGQEAVDDLQRHGFNVNYTMEASRLQSRGNVIKTIPPAGSMLPAGTEVKVVIAQ